jgi:CRP/FNR family transcriptional regulator
MQDFIPKCQCERCDLRDMFFGFVGNDEMDNICISRREIQHLKGDLIISEGQDISEFIYLKEGLVKLFKSDNGGKNQILAIGKPLDFVSLLSVFSDNTYKYSVTALEESVTCHINLERITGLAEQNGRFALNVMRKMSRISDEVILDLLIVRKKMLRGRVAHVLLMFSKDIFFSRIFDLPISRREFAEYIGMTTENVIRTLSEFRKDKILRIYGKSIEIIEMERLQAISEHG